MGLFRNQEWKALKLEIEDELFLMTDKLKSPSCENRDFQAGMCHAVSVVLEIEHRYDGKDGIHD